MSSRPAPNLTLPLTWFPDASSLPYLLPFANTLFSLEPRVTGCVLESLGWLRVIVYSQTVHVQNTKTLTWQRHTLYTATCPDGSFCLLASCWGDFLLFVF